MLRQRLRQQGELQLPRLLQLAAVAGAHRYPGAQIATSELIGAGGEQGQVASHASGQPQDAHQSDRHHCQAVGEVARRRRPNLPQRFAGGTGDPESQAGLRIGGFRDDPLITTPTAEVGARVVGGRDVQAGYQASVGRIGDVEVAVGIQCIGHLALGTAGSRDHLPQDAGGRNQGPQVALDLATTPHRAAEVAAQKQLSLVCCRLEGFDLTCRQQPAVAHRLPDGGGQILLGDPGPGRIGPPTRLEALDGIGQRLGRVKVERLRFGLGRELEGFHQSPHLAQKSHQVGVDSAGARAGFFRIPQHVQPQLAQPLDAARQIAAHPAHALAHLAGENPRLGLDRIAKGPVRGDIGIEDDPRQRHDGQQQESHEKLGADSHPRRAVLQLPACMI
jgi:hypothetical protein